MGPLAGVHAHRWVDAPPSSGSLAGPNRAHTLTDPEAAVVLQLLVTTVGSSTGGHHVSRAHSSERWLRIYPHGVWIHPCHTRFLCQNRVLIVCMTQDQMFHTYRQKCSQIIKSHNIVYNYYINNVFKN
jgi:hypothetical protein